MKTISQKKFHQGWEVLRENLETKLKMLYMYSSSVKIFEHKQITSATYVCWLKFFLFFFFFFVFFGSHPWHMEIPRLGVELELQPLAYTTATAMPDLSHICNLHQSVQQRRILNPLSKAKDRTYVLMDNRFVSTEP